MNWIKTQWAKFIPWYKGLDENEKAAFWLVVGFLFGWAMG